MSTSQKSFLIGKTVAEFSFIEILLVVIIAWVLVALWQRFIENLAYHSLHLNIDSAYHTFIVAAVITLIFIGFAIIFENGVGGTIQKEVESATPAAPVGPGVLQTRDLNQTDSLSNITKLYDKNLPSLFINESTRNKKRNSRRPDRYGQAQSSSRRP